MDEKEETLMEKSWIDQLVNPCLPRLDRHDLFEILYKTQMKKLERISEKLRGLDSGKVYMLGKMTHHVLKVAMKVFRPNCYPFVPVLPKGELFTFYDILNATSSGSDPWIQSLNLKYIEEIINPHVIPFIIFNIDPGDDTRGMSPQEGLGQIKSRKCPKGKENHAVNLAGGFAIRTHMEMFKNLSLHACASSYRGKYIPGLHNTEKGSELTWTEPNKMRENWVCPSFEVSLPAFSWHGLTSPKAYANFLKKSKK